MSEAHKDECAMHLGENLLIDAIEVDCRWHWPVTQRLWKIFAAVFCISAVAAVFPTFCVLMTTSFALLVEANCWTYR